MPVRNRLARRLLPAALFAVVLASTTTAHADAVPDVTGLSLAEAESLLQGAGFTARVEYDAQRPTGVVARQDPTGFANRPRGSVVRLVVGGAPPSGSAPTVPPPAAPSNPTAPPEPTPPAGGFPSPGPVATIQRAPTLIGLTMDEARRLIGSTPLKYERTLGVPELDGRIVSQWPVPGDRVLEGGSITLVIGVKEMPSVRHAIVPDVTGLDRRAAENVLREAGFGARSARPYSGRVVIHHPLPESLAILGSVVELEVDPAPGEQHAGSSSAASPSIPTPVPAPRPAAIRIAPVLRSPAEADTYSDAIPLLFDWQPVEGADGHEWQLLREGANGVVQQVSREWVTTRPLQRHGLARGRYLWRVRAVGPGGAGPWSPPRSLYVY